MVSTKKAYSRLLVDISCKFGPSSFRGLKDSDPVIMSPANSSSSIRSLSSSPFNGLVICVTGLSKEARKQVMEATERLGGQYSPHLHPRCTHLVVQISFSFFIILISGGRKFEHALKHGATNGLLIVTLGWFVDSVRRNVRLSEALYVEKSIGENHAPKDYLDELASGNSCLPVAMLENAKQPNMIQKSRIFSSEEELKRRGSVFSGQSFYVDPEVSVELQNKVVEAAFGQGGSLADQWLPGHSASHVVCEDSSVQKYLGHSSYLVTPLWVLKTVKETRPQRLVHLSADLARQIGMMLDNVQQGATHRKDNNGANDSQDAQILGISSNHKENQNIVTVAKNGVRNRRGRRLQACQAPIKPLTPPTLLDSICWSISEPSSSASIYTDSEEAKTSINEDGKESDASFENMSRTEIELAIHTDSRHADRLRSVYASKEAAEIGYVEIKRIEFLGSRKSFEMLKRVPGENNSNVYELSEVEYSMACQAPIKPLTPPTLLDSICWSISVPSSSASIYTDSEEAKTSINEDGKESDASFVNSSRPLSEFEKNEFVFKNHFLTILFPVDRFSEMGPSSKTFFSDSGFTCLQLLNKIYAFYQENMSRTEIELAIHTDSRHADRLRSVYASKEAAEIGYVEIKRIEFLGSRKSFEMLKRVPGENNSNVYELLTRA
ncbi:putative BRCT domain-containing protein [Tanacetum coccineum]